MHYIISCLVAVSSLNSRYDPHESAANAPNKVPKARSSKLFLALA